MAAEALRAKVCSAWSTSITLGTYGVMTMLYSDSALCSFQLKHMYACAHSCFRRRAATVTCCVHCRSGKERAPGAARRPGAWSS